ncbi:pilus assembly protein [Prochlorococcus sp. MIT 1223]|uniref:pilus assembly protein n=1 Tax=Prochlorococcus sp. MIT 1223 TaxID=3096217 RepID=UPI002A75B1B9|nr:pilus assembly protein [Prochlorococcus sp. MIT 1223]
MKPITNSDSIISGLCREIEYIKLRSQSIMISLTYCKNQSLIRRLNNELSHLNKRKVSIKEMATILETQCMRNSLSIDLLNEIIGRTLIKI